MPPTQELRAFLSDLERECPEQMLRIDRESDEPFSDEDRQKLEERLLPLLERADVLCVSDYYKGLVTCGITSRAVEAMHAAEDFSLKCTITPACKLQLEGSQG